MPSLSMGGLQLPTMSSLLSLYASLSAVIMIVRTILNDMIPESIRDFISRKASDFFSSYFSRDFTFLIEDHWEAVENETFRAVQAYLPTKVGPDTSCLLLGHNDNNNLLAAAQPGVSVYTRIVDHFEGMKLEWTLNEKEEKNNSSYYTPKNQWFQLRCRRIDKERVMDSYIPHICRTAEKIFYDREILSIYTYNQEESNWESTVFKHPATFETLAMEPEQKQGIIDDLDLFVRRKEYFRTVGRAWKRGYLLWGPPGTGKSTLVAAIANHLRFHIYDLQLQGVRSDFELRKVLTATTNRSILLIEDVDCSSKSTEPRSTDEITNDDENQPDDKKRSSDKGVTLSGLLNFIDGLWSSCGDERIIIFTTNHKEKLDPALLRPGRMDVHVYMGHCTAAGFKLLAGKYLGIQDHELFKRIEDLMRKFPATPAEVAQQLMISGKPEVALDGLVEFLKGKDVDRIEKIEGEEESKSKNLWCLMRKWKNKKKKKKTPLAAEE
ncbi:unnamed protein product [Linum tenue]|uniref:AAA+ ATPase domain-containing protein n=1 Tax=Linum tenue TaxID=586396 RepID=A0AAV0RDE7_9ROSI|nr:unnamed protein product [Linum tenue]